MEKQQERRECSVTKFNPKLHCKVFVRMTENISLSGQTSGAIRETVGSPGPRPGPGGEMVWGLLLEWVKKKNTNLLFCGKTHKFV